MKSEEVHIKSLTMVLAIEKILEDSIIKQSNPLLISETTLQSRGFLNGVKPSELLDELLQSMNYRTMIPLMIIIDSDKNKLTKFHNHLLIIDGDEGFRRVTSIILYIFENSK